MDDYIIRCEKFEMENSLIISVVCSITMSAYVYIKRKNNDVLICIVTSVHKNVLLDFMYNNVIIILLCTP